MTLKPVQVSPAVCGWVPDFSVTLAAATIDRNPITKRF